MQGQLFPQSAHSYLRKPLCSPLRRRSLRRDPHRRLLIGRRLLGPVLAAALRRYSAESAAAIKLVMSRAASGIDATPRLAVTRITPDPSTRGISAASMR
jgi:hypothetical protein